MASTPGHTSFTVTLPDEVIETMMDLLPSKLYGANRAEIARSLIQDMLKQLAGRGLVRVRGLPGVPGSDRAWAAIPIFCRASQSSITVTMSPISHSRLLTPAAMAGVQRNEAWMRTKL